MSHSGSIVAPSADTPVKAPSQAPQPPQSAPTKTGRNRRKHRKSNLGSDASQPRVQLPAGPSSQCVGVIPAPTPEPVPQQSIPPLAPQQAPALQQAPARPQAPAPQHPQYNLQPYSAALNNVGTYNTAGMYSETGYWNPSPHYPHHPVYAPYQQGPAYNGAQYPQTLYNGGPYRAPGPSGAQGWAGVQGSAQGPVAPAGPAMTGNQGWTAQGWVGIQGSAQGPVTPAGPSLTGNQGFALGPPPSFGPRSIDIGARNTSYDIETPTKATAKPLAHSAPRPYRERPPVIVCSSKPPAPVPTSTPRPLMVSSTPPEKEKGTSQTIPVQKPLAAGSGHDGPVMTVVGDSQAQSNNRPVDSPHGAAQPPPNDTPTRSIQSVASGIGSSLVITEKAVAPVMKAVDEAVDKAEPEKIVANKAATAKAAADKAAAEKAASAKLRDLERAAEEQKAAEGRAHARARAALKAKAAAEAKATLGLKKEAEAKKAAQAEAVAPAKSVAQQKKAAEIKAAVARVAEKAKAEAEALLAAQAKVAAEEKAAADAKVAANIKAAAKAREEAKERVARREKKEAEEKEAAAARARLAARSKSRSQANPCWEWLTGDVRVPDWPYAWSWSAPRNSVESAPKSSPETGHRGQHDGGPMAYIGNLPGNVLFIDLGAALARYGELAYMDINSREKCAFVGFRTPEGFAAAIAASPIVVNGEKIAIEKQRPKPYASCNIQFGDLTPIPRSRPEEGEVQTPELSPDVAEGAKRVLAFLELDTPPKESAEGLALQEAQNASQPSSYGGTRVIKPPPGFEGLSPVIMIKTPQGSTRMIKPMPRRRLASLRPSTQKGWNPLPQFNRPMASWQSIAGPSNHSAQPGGAPQAKPVMVVGKPPWISPLAGLVGKSDDVACERLSPARMAKYYPNGLPKKLGRHIPIPDAWASVLPLKPEGRGRNAAEEARYKAKLDRAAAATTDVFGMTMDEMVEDVHLQHAWANYLADLGMSRAEYDVEHNKYADPTKSEKRTNPFARMTVEEVRDMDMQTVAEPMVNMMFRNLLLLRAEAALPAGHGTWRRRFVEDHPAIRRGGKEEACSKGGEGDEDDVDEEKTAVDKGKAKEKEFRKTPRKPKQLLGYPV